LVIGKVSRAIRSALRLTGSSRACRVRVIRWTWRERGLYGAISAPIRIGEREEIRRPSGWYALAGVLSAQVKVDRLAVACPGRGPHVVIEVCIRGESVSGVG